MTEYNFGKWNIYITDSVMDLVKDFRQIKSNDNEAGGILIGQVKDNNIYILKASIPNKFDTSSRYNFECKKEMAQIIIEYEFYNSGKKSIYFGEWHTHPQDIPIPSSIDKSMISNQFKRNKLNEPFLILLIQGNLDLYVGFYDGKKLNKTKLIEEVAK